MHFGPVPNEIRGVQHFMKLAEDHDERNVVVSYYARMAAIQMAMKIIPGQKPPEVGKYLITIMDWLEKSKHENAGVEGIGNETIAQAVIEEYMLKLYEFAYNSDTSATFNKNMVKAYYTASLLCEVLLQFGPLSEDLSNKCKMAKYRAAYIHNMLKNGQEPTPVNVTVVSDDEDELLLTKEEVNHRRALRGEDPVEDHKPPQLSPEELESKRKAIEEIRKRGNPEFVEDLRKIKERIDADESHNIEIEDMDIFKPPTEPMIPERIIDVGPPIYPEPRLPARPVQPPQTPQSPQTPASTNLFDSKSVATLDAVQTEKAMKYCKWASSALNYDDVKTAVENLEKGLYLCRFGKEKQ